MKHRLPDGTETDDDEVYIRAWRTLQAKVLAVFPGYQVHSFDPGARFVRLERHSYDYKMIEVDSFELSTAAMLAMTAPSANEQARSLQKAIDDLVTAYTGRRWGGPDLEKL